MGNVVRLVFDLTTETELLVDLSADQAIGHGAMISSLTESINEV